MKRPVTSNHRIVNESRLRVRYAETDRMGVVYHSNHLIWFEVGRVELLRQLGFSYRVMEEEDDCYIVVMDARCRYKAPARYDDEIIVRTYLKHARASLVQFGYELLRVQDTMLLAEGDTTHLVVDSKMRKKLIPGKYLSAFRMAMGK